jgi:hypothetical protein
MIAMTLTTVQVKRIQAMNHGELIANAQSEDLAVVVEASLRLHRATIYLNIILILLTVVLVDLTYALVHYAAK